MPRYTLTLAACLLAMAAGCSSPPAGGAADPVPVESPVADTTTTAPPSLPAEGPKRMGKTQTTAGTQGEFSVSVARVRRPFKAVVPGLPERAGYEYAAANVKFCVTDDKGSEVRIGWSAWSATTVDGVVVESLSAWSADWWTEPLYPQDHVVKVGRCVRGWLPFEVQRGSKLDIITYSPDEMNELEWKVR
ncbi:hypothetical protein E1295_31790 [Nonomuraea mesophila]|uniref:DUF4352 domain-containing protein n=1 Tax=Nonomuraea mesophila TaxID=2530382 RepID=A0A4R5EZJ6_9ACTN|nr:hypothetical protein [Nonomuraea mesophila]TDE40483.1 hypothetical protein E1295_31790 [Nonomuraea mesophila]